MRSIYATLILSFLGSSIYAQRGIVPAEQCENDWSFRSQKQIMSSEAEVRFFEGKANSGDVAAQHRLGLVRQTYDGKWRPPAGYNAIWLGKAANGGSKTAAAQLAELQFRAQWDEGSAVIINFSDYVNALTVAAEEENSAWSATKLLELSFESSKDPGRCPETLRRRELCNPSATPPLTDASRWAKIAGEGGNPYAQGLMCRWAQEGSAATGQPEDEGAAFKWCLIASHNACQTDSPKRLSYMYQTGRGTQKDAEEAKRWLGIANQRRLPDAGIFFTLP